MPSPPHEVKVRQISQGVEDIDCDDGTDVVEGAQIPEVASFDGSEGTTPVAASGTPSAIEGSAEQDAGAGDSTMQDSEKSSDSEGNEEKRLKRKLADRATSHGPETSQAIVGKKSARPKVNDNSPRAKKRISSPGTPEMALDAKKLTPPSTPPALDDKISEPLKRPREDGEKDDNPRHTKKPTPPPETVPDLKDLVMTTPKPVSSTDLVFREILTNIQLQSGFMAYASTNSPFASVKGQNIFGSRSKPTSFFKAVSPSPSPAPVFAQSSFGKSSSPPSMPTSPTASKRTGFEAFAGSASPFASVSKPSSSALRSKSPPRTRASASKNTSAFTSYASGGAQAFAVPVTKRARASTPPNEIHSSRSSLERNSTLSVFGGTAVVGGDRGQGKKRDDGQLSFGEKLRAGKDTDETASDEEAKPELTAQAGVYSCFLF